MNAKKALPLVIALVLGAISARMVVKIIQNRPTNAQTSQGPKLTQVVVAARDISAGQQLGSDDLEMIAIPATATAGATFSNLDDLYGRVVAAPLVHGQAVLDSLLAPKGSGSGLQAAIPPGMRALTIDINETSGVAGYLTPGCHVDIDLSLHDDATNQMIDKCLVQNVPVTAVGTRPVIGQDITGVAHSVTLLVTPRQAEMIDLGSANGRTRLVLRNSMDHATDDLPVVTLNELAGGHGLLAAAPATRPADPFATATPSAQKIASNDWQVRVITAGETNLVSIRATKSPGSSAVTGADPKDATAP